MEAEPGDASVTELCVFPARRINLENVKSWLTLVAARSRSRVCTTTDISQIIGNTEVSVVAGPTFFERAVRQGLSGTKSPAGNPAESRPVGKLIKSFGSPDPFLAYKLVARVQSSKRVLFKRAKI